MRPSTTALAFGSAAALALSGVSAAEPGAGEARTPQPPASASATPPAATPPTAAPPSSADSPDTAPTPSPYDGQASPEAGTSEQGPHRPAPAAALRPQLVQRPPPAEQPVAPARDTVGGHFAVAVDAGLLVPFGSVASGIPQSRTMGLGLSIGGDLAYGISRTVMLGAYIDVGLPSAEGASSSHSISTFAAGPLIRYHLVQGMAFDPWLSGGIGFRRTTDGPTSFNGIDWMRLALGGDWYPASNFGFGPILELSLGTFFSQSPGSLGNASVNASFVLGARFVFDVPGK